MEHYRSSIIPSNFEEYILLIDTNDISLGLKYALE